MLALFHPPQRSSEVRHGAAVALRQRERSYRYSLRRQGDIPPLKSTLAGLNGTLVNGSNERRVFQSGEAAVTARRCHARHPYADNMQYDVWVSIDRRPHKFKYVPRG